jgi:F-type H+-transporting ATPase subunit gamma
MSSASDNAKDMIDRYTLAMNRARQAAITTKYPKSSLEQLL